MLRAHMASAICMLGSATPSLESYYLSEQKRIERLVLKERAQKQLMPQVEVVDLARNNGLGPAGNPLISGPLLPCARANASPLAIKRSCSSIDVASPEPPLRELRPHRCPVLPAASRSPSTSEPVRCAVTTATSPCRSPKPARAAAHCELERVGVGTERIEEALEQAFPGGAHRSTRSGHCDGQRRRRGIGQDARPRARRAGGHADGHQGTRPARRHSGRRVARGSEPGVPGLSRRRAHLPAASPGGRSSRPW